MRVLTDGIKSQGSNKGSPGYYVNMGVNVPGKWGSMVGCL